MNEKNWKRIILYLIAAIDAMMEEESPKRALKKEKGKDVTKQYFIWFFLNFSSVKTLAIRLFDSDQTFYAD